MANTYVRLAGSTPPTTAEIELYASSANQYVVGELFICNTGAAATTYRVAITATAGAASGGDWIHYDFPIAANMSHKFTVAFGNGNTLRVRDGTGDTINFLLMGLLIT
jgi:hypothetical protein